MKSILIIETDEPALRALAVALRDQGWDVVTVSEPAQARSAGLRPEVIVFNTNTPAEDKRLWISSIRYLLPGVRVLDIASKADPVLSDSGADGYIYPPLEPGAVLKALDGDGFRTSGRETPS